MSSTAGPIVEQGGPGALAIAAVGVAMARSLGSGEAINQHVRGDVAPIPFIDIAAQRRRLGDAIDTAVERVLEHCQFILGPEVRALEDGVGGISAAPGMPSPAPAAPMRWLLGVDGQGHRPRRRRDLPFLHVLRHRGSGRRWWARPRYSPMLTPRPSTWHPASVEPRIGTAHERGLEPKDHSGRPVRTAGGLRRHQRDRRN